MQNNQKIPKGWSVKKLGEISCLIAGNAFNSEDFIDMGIPLIRISNIADDGIVLDENTAFLPESFLKENSKFVIRQTDLLIAMSGATTGKMGINTFSEPMLLNQRVCIIRAKDVSQNFLNQYLFTHKKDILRQSYGGAQPNIGNNDIKKIKVLLPPLPEQEKIALVLGTWDEAIEKLSNLIEQKKLLKKGLMQKLLTGKTRLPGFTQPWKEVAIQDFCNIKRGGSPRPIENYLTSSDDGLNWLKIGDISPDAKYIYKTESKIKKDGVSKTTLVHSDDFILSNSMSFGRPYIMKIDACIHDGWLALTSIKKDVSKEFLFYLLSFSETQKKFNICAAGSGVRNLNKDIVGEVKIQLPPYYEQQAIADVLSTADDEINLLNQKLEALKEQKKGLMQQLLTGQIRVKVN